MAYKNTVEILYLSLMLRWEETAPDDGCQGYLDGVPTRNSQAARLAFVLSKIGAGKAETTYKKLALASRRESDDESYISQKKLWMKKAIELHDGWFLESCQSLIQKKNIISALGQLGMSSDFLRAVETFVEGKSIKPLLPSHEEQERILAKCLAEENLREA